MAEIETIQGKSKESDKKLVKKIDLTELDVNRINAVDHAFEYIQKNANDRAVAFTPAMIVGSFGIGAGLIIILWVLTTYLPVVDHIKF